MKAIRIALLPLILAAIIALFSMAGCAGGGTTSTLGAPQGELSQQQLEQILNDSMMNQENLNTYKFDMYMDISMGASGGTQPGTAGMEITGSGATNMAAKEMQMTMDMSVNADIVGQQKVSQTTSIEMYVLSEWTYMKMAAFGMGEQWLKIPTTEELKQSFNANAVEQQMGILDMPAKIEYLRTEKVDGIDCYVLDVTPNINELGQWLGELNTGLNDTDFQDLVNYSDVFKKLSFACYITKDSKLLKKMAVEMLMDYTAQQAGDISSQFDTMSMAISMDMKMYDYNVPFSIVLPDEAENAMEAPA